MFLFYFVPNLKLLSMSFTFLTVRHASSVANQVAAFVIE